MSLISFKFHTKTLLFLFGLAILNGFQEYIYSNIIPKNPPPKSTNDNNDEQYNPLLLIAIIYFGEICCGILEIIRRKRNMLSQLMNIDSTLQEKERSKQLKIKRTDIAFIILISIFDFSVVAYICYKQGLRLFDISSILKICQIIFLGILSQFCLSFKLFRHHIVTQICIGAGLIILSFFAILNGIHRPPQEKKKDNDDGKNPIIVEFVLLFLIYLINSTKIIIEKYLMDKRYYSPFIILFNKGCIGISLTFIAYIIIIKVNQCTDPNGYQFLICEYNYDLNKAIQSLITLFMSLFFFCSLGINIITQLIIQFFNPSYLAIGDSIGGLFIWILSHYIDWKRPNDGEPPKPDAPPDDRKWFCTLLFGSFIYVIIAICCLIYTEIMILDCLGMKYYTKEEIEKRAEKESNALSGLLNLSAFDESESEQEEKESYKENSIL